MGAKYFTMQLHMTSVLMAEYSLVHAPPPPPLVARVAATGLSPLRTFVSDVLQDGSLTKSF
jgi:hypothetical protein